MQKAIIVSDTSGGASLKELNKFFDEGYFVVMTCPMVSSTATGGTFPLKIEPTCLVIIEK